MSIVGGAGLVAHVVTPFDVVTEHICRPAGAGVPHSGRLFGLQHHENLLALLLSQQRLGVALTLVLKRGQTFLAIAPS